MTTDKQRTTPATNGENGVSIGEQGPGRKDEPFKRGLPEERRLLVLIQHAINAADAVLDAHGDDCDCDLCDDVRAFHYNSRLSHDLIDGLVGFFNEDAEPCPICNPLEDASDADGTPAEPAETGGNPYPLIVVPGQSDNPFIPKRAQR